MDLVDIDKVLDNLELNEEQYKDRNLVTKQIKHVNTNLRATDVLVMNASVSTNDAADENIMNCQEPMVNPTCDRTNRFIGVSQVFSSLDDYRRNVESLNADMQLYKADEPDEINVYQSSGSSCQTEELYAKTKGKNEFEENQCLQDDISKFDEERGFSSNSITTSSSSSFSSGPSSALLSTGSESLFDTNLMDKSSLLFQNDDGHVKLLDNNLKKEVENKNDYGKEPQNSEFDDLAVGLSSISLTAQANTLSSEIISSKCILKIDNISSSLSLSQTNKNLSNSEDLVEKTKESINSADQNVSNFKQAALESDRVGTVFTAAQQTSQQNVMITFGSTMDEISDTELDSILQEIDSEMPQTGFETGIPDKEKKKYKVDRKSVLSNEDHIKTANSYSSNAYIDEKSEDITNIEGLHVYTVENPETRNDDGEINDCKVVDEHCEDDEQEIKHEQCTAQKRQRPTTLDLPIRKINLYASAGQTPPGTRSYDQVTSSSEEDTPEDRVGLLPSDEKDNLNDAAGHTPPERSDRSLVDKNSTDETINSAINYDEPMTVADNTGTENSTLAQTINSDINPNLGKVPPIWVPDHEASSCMQCQHKFTLLKRRHHCRACGQVLCSVCCSQKFKLEFLSNPESRVCVQCFLILTKLQQQMEQQTTVPTVAAVPLPRTPNPNNPMEYCSTIPPHRQVNTQALSNPTVIVPVGVLKKEGNIKKSRKRKSVMFSDGIRPGSDLASLDGKWSDAKHARKSVSTSFSDNSANTSNVGTSKIVTRNNAKTLALLDGSDNFIPRGEHLLPPIYTSEKSDKVYEDVPNNADLIKRLHTESLKFVVQTNFYVYVKISHLKCCINKTVINFTTSGLHHVGNDEIMILLELDNSNEIPKDIFIHLNEIYLEASKGHPITELGFSMPKDLLFLGSREHGGFLFIRSTFQCLQDVQVPNPPFLIGVLIHRWEIPWAKIFPLRLMLRLGAQYRYYPSPHISVREREPVYAEIAQTIINLLADFRNYSYTLPTIKGMFIHMEDRSTNILIPRNRHDEILKAINNSSDHILAMGANFSKKADGHLVCIQNIKAESTDSHSYSTQAINIQGQPRKVTGASFFVLNESLKTTSGLSGKCSIVEDGLMVQILPAKMVEIKNALVNMKDINIICGPIEGGEQHTEVVHIQWIDDDIDINIGVKSPIDAKEMDGISSIRVHSGISLSNGNHTLKWTELFLLEVNESDEFSGSKSTVDLSKVSEQIAKNVAVALLPFLDLLAANGNIKIGLRVTLNQDNVCYEAGSQNEKLPPLYMNALDNELVPILHKQANEIGKNTILELVFYILNV